MGVAARSVAVDPLQAGHPCLLSFEGAAEGLRLAQLTAALGTARPGVGIGPGGDDSQLQLILRLHPFHVGQGLGEMGASVEEDDFHFGVDAGDQVDQHAILERAHQGQLAAEALHGPGHDLFGFGPLRTGRRAARYSVAGSSSPTMDSCVLIRLAGRDHVTPQRPSCPRNVRPGTTDSGAQRVRSAAPDAMYGHSVPIGIVNSNECRRPGPGHSAAGSQRA